MLVKIGFLTLLLSTILCFLIIILSRKNGKFLDNHNGVQNIHKSDVPRIGGLAILISLAVGLIIFFIRFKEFKYISLLLSALPITLAGLYEDIEHKLSPRFRLLISFISALVAIFLLEAYIIRTGLFFLDYLVKYKIISVIFSAIAIAGITNAINIIDGLNGLSSGTAMILLTAIGYMAFKFQDFFLLSIITLMGAAILGFFIWNYPYGRIFLGDGGAYVIGFILAITSILLVKRNPAVSPWFPILVLIYPVFETIFSIYRRKFKKRKSAIIADTLHLHSLYYRRVIPYLFRNRLEPRSLNSATTPFLWILCSASIVPAVLFWNETIILMVFAAAFSLGYLILYYYLISFRLGLYIKRLLNGKTSNLSIINRLIY